MKLVKGEERGACFVVLLRKGEMRVYVCLEDIREIGCLGGVGVVR